MELQPADVSAVATDVASLQAEFVNEERSAGNGGLEHEGVESLLAAGSDESASAVSEISDAEEELPGHFGDAPPAAPSDDPGGLDPNELLEWEDDPPPTFANLGGRRRGTLSKPVERPAMPPSPTQKLLLLDTWLRSGLPARDFGALVTSRAIRSTPGSIGSSSWGQHRPDIPILVVESLAGKDVLAQIGLDLSGLPNLHWMAATPDPREFYRLTKFVLMPSLWNEVFPLVPAEAMLNGIPIIASNRGGLPETVGEGGSCSTFQLAILRRLCNSARRRSFALG